MSGKLILRGIQGLLKDRDFQIEYGQTITLGRSRSCDICLDNQTGENKTVVQTGDGKHLQTVSRKHLRISFVQKDRILLEDLSSNGTYLDGHRIDKAEIKDFQKKTHIIILGTKEKFVIGWRAN